MVSEAIRASRVHDTAARQRVDVLRRALREGRVFSTNDRNASVRVLANGNVWMGSSLSRPGPVALRIEVADADAEGFDRIELVSNGQVVQTQTLNGSQNAVWEVTVDPGVDAYFYAHVFQDDSDELISTPIYIDR